MVDSGKGWWSVSSSDLTDHEGLASIASMSSCFELVEAMLRAVKSVLGGLV